MKILGFTAKGGKRIGIPVSKICGFTETAEVIQAGGSYCYISTGPEDEDGYNGWFVVESYEEVWMMLESTALEANNG